MHRGFLLTLVLGAFCGKAATAGVDIAVIDENGPPGTNEGSYWCEIITNAGHVCTLFPGTGPTTALDTFEIVVDLSEQWTDPTGLLQQHMRARKGLILWNRAPLALGINSDPTVRAMIGALSMSSGSEALVTTTRDPILGNAPPGTEVANCFDGPCGGLTTDGSFPQARTLARFANDTVGIHRNTWEGGQLVYLCDLVHDTETIHRCVNVLSNPIPASSGIGLAIIALGIVASALILFKKRTSCSAFFISLSAVVLNPRALMPRN